MYIGAVFHCFAINLSSTESLGAGDFSIQGASDGHSQADPHANFKIQGATDGHSDFQIQGASGGDSQGFTIQGPSDSGVAYVQPGAYQRGVDDTGRDNSGKALNYQDPSGKKKKTITIILSHKEQSAHCFLKRIGVE